MSRRAIGLATIGLSITALISVVLMTPVIQKQYLRFRAIQELLAAVDGKGPSHWNANIADAARDVKQLELQEEALSAILPLLEVPGRRKLGAMIYLVGAVDSPRPDVVDALLRVANNKTFPPDERVEALEIVIWLKPNQDVLQSAKNSIAKIQQSAPAATR